MNLKKRTLSVFTAAAIVISLSSLNVFASTQLDKEDYSYTKYGGKEGKTLEDLQELAEDYFDSHFNVDADDFECTNHDMDSDDETEDDETYTLKVYDDDFDIRSSYDEPSDAPSKLTYTYIVGDAGEITDVKIFEKGVSGKSLAYVLDKAEDAFEAKHYDVSEAKFEQTNTPELSSSVKTKKGEIYTFVWEDPVADDGYYTDASKVTYVYDVDKDEDDDDDDDDDDDKSEPAYGSKKGWTSINSSLSSASSNSRIVVKMNKNYTLPAETLSSIKGKDIDLVLDFDSYAWSINGENVSSTKDIDLEAKFGGNDISSSVVNKVAGSRKTIQLELSYSGKFGFKGTLNAKIDSDYARKYANLYYYNPSTNSLEYQGCGMISSDGYATFSFNHASEYVIIIDSTPMGVDLNAGVEADDNTIPITAQASVPYIVAVVVLTLGMIVIKQRKAHK